MVRMRAALAVFALLALLLSGCLGGDEDVETEGDDSVPRPTGETGSIVGQIFDLDLNPIGDATVSVVTGTELVKSTTTRPDGTYVLNDVPPGTYRLRVSALCCHEVITEIIVVANEETRKSFQLEPFSAIELREPYFITDEKVTKITCQFTTPWPDGVPYGNHTQTCPGLGPNNPTVDLMVGKGLRTIIAAIEWPPGGNPQSELQFTVRHPGEGSGYAYAQELGSSPILHRVDNDDVTKESVRFDSYDEEDLVLQLYVQPAPGTFLYEQTIHFYWSLHYWNEAPDGFQVLPG